MVQEDTMIAASQRTPEQTAALDKVRYLMAELDELTDDQIAGRLYDAGVRTRKDDECDSWRCAMARYVLQVTGVFVSFGPWTHSIYDAVPDVDEVEEDERTNIGKFAREHLIETESNPLAVEQFITKFDTGDYPQFFETAER